MNKVSKVLSISLITNIGLSFFKMIFGFIGNSGSLIADGLHSFSDLVTDLIGIVGAYFSKKPSDEKHPYGHGKMEYLISIFIGIIIFALGLTVVYNSVTRNIIVPSLIVVIVSLVVIIVKFILAHYLIKQGEILNNNILISSGKESSTDVISSVVVLISSILMQFNIKILQYSDIIAGIIVGIFVIKVGLEVLKENISTILGEQETDSKYLEEIKISMLISEDIKNISDLIILKYGPYYKLISTVNITANISVLEASKIIDNIEKNIKNKFKKIDYIYISIKPSL